VLERREERDAEVVIVDPFFQATRFIEIIDYVPERLHDVRVDPLDEAHDLRRVPVGEADEANLPLLLQPAHRFERAIEVLIAISEVAVMKVVEIDDVGPQISERALALRPHERRIVEMVRWACHPSELRRQKNVGARNLLERFADQFFGMSVSVRVGSVPMGDATPMRFDERLCRLTIVMPAPPDRDALARVRTSMTPRAETDRRNASIRAAEANRAHGGRL